MTTLPLSCNAIEHAGHAVPTAWTESQPKHIASHADYVSRTANGIVESLHEIIYLYQAPRNSIDQKLWLLARPMTHEQPKKSQYFSAPRCDPTQNPTHVRHVSFDCR